MSWPYAPAACDHENCLRPAAEKVWRDNGNGGNYFAFLCEKHLPVTIRFPDGTTTEVPG